MNSPRRPASSGMVNPPFATLTVMGAMELSFAEIVSVPNDAFFTTPKTPVWAPTYWNDVSLIRSWGEFADASTFIRPTYPVGTLGVKYTNPLAEVIALAVLKVTPWKSETTHCTRELGCMVSKPAESR